VHQTALGDADTDTGARYLGCHIVNKPHATHKKNPAQIIPSAYSMLSQPNAVAGTVAGIASTMADKSQPMMVLPELDRRDFQMAAGWQSSRLLQLPARPWLLIGAPAQMS
jgi:hypothetical protein